MHIQKQRLEKAGFTKITEGLIAFRVDLQSTDLGDDVVSQLVKENDSWAVCGDFVYALKIELAELSNQHKILSDEINDEYYRNFNRFEAVTLMMDVFGDAANAAYDELPFSYLDQL